MSLTAKSLIDIPIDMKTKRYLRELPTEDIPMLQEFAFVKHRNEIMAYFENLKAKEEKLFKELKVSIFLLFNLYNPVIIQL